MTEKTIYAHVAGVNNSIPAKSQQVGGDHYMTLGVQPWTAMESWMAPEAFQGFLLGNVIKYCARKKGDKLEDLRKARHYLDRLIETMEGK